MENKNNIVSLLAPPDTERWIDLNTQTLYERVTVWQKGVSRLRSEKFGGGGYRESTKTRSLSPEELSELIRQDEAKRAKRKAAEDEAAAYQKRMRDYQSLWEAYEDEEVFDGFRVRTCYGGPHIADKHGNILFSIPRDIKSLEELKQKIEGLLDRYYGECDE